MLVQDKKTYLKEMEKDIAARTKLNEKRGKVYEDIKLKQTQNADKIKHKKQWFKSRLDQYQRRKAEVQV